MVEAFYTDPTYIGMCDRATELKEQFRNLPSERKIGTWIVWRSFLGIIVPTRYVSESEWEDKLPEYRVLHWLNKGLDIRVVDSKVSELSEMLTDPDLGTPVFDMSLLDTLMDWRKVSDKYLIPIERISRLPWILREGYGWEFVKFGSIEQAFLAAVMWVNYGKKWDFGFCKWAYVIEDDSEKWSLFKSSSKLILDDG